MNKVYQREQPFLKVDNKESALSDFNQYIMLDKSNPEAYYIRGKIKYNIKDFKSSIDDFSNAIILNPNHESAYFKRGFAKHETEDIQGCSSDLQTTLNKGNLEAYNYLKEYCNN